MTYNLEYDDFYEGVNYDTHIKYKEFRETFKLLQAQYKSAMKNGDFKLARKTCDAMAKEVQTTIKYIESLKGTMGSTVLGYFLPTLKEICWTITLSFVMGAGLAVSGASAILTGGASLVVPPMMATLGVAAASSSYAVALVKSLYNVITFIDEVLKLYKIDGELNIGQFDAYKNRIVVQLRETQRTILKYKSQIDLVEAAYNKQLELVEGVTDIYNYDSYYEHSNARYKTYDATQKIRHKKTELDLKIKQIKDEIHKVKDKMKTDDSNALKNRFNALSRKLNILKEKYDKLDESGRAQKYDYSWLDSPYNRHMDRKNIATSDVYKDQVKEFGKAAKDSWNKKFNSRYNGSKKDPYADRLPNAYATKESADAIRLQIYENYDCGLISESEKDYLLDHLNYVASNMNESTFESLLNDITKC